MVGRKRFSCVWCIPQPPQVVETSCPMSDVYTERNAQGMQQISCYTAHSCAHWIYWLSSAPAALGPKSLLSQYISCGTRACVTTITCGVACLYMYACIYVLQFTESLQRMNKNVEHLCIPQILIILRKYSYSSKTDHV